MDKQHGRIPPARALARQMLRQHTKARQAQKLLEREYNDAAGKYDALVINYTQAAKRAELAPEAVRPQIARVAAELHANVKQAADALCAARRALADHQGRCALLDGLIAHLPEREREVIELRYIKGKSWTAIGHAMYLAPPTARLYERGAVDRIARELKL